MRCVSLSLLCDELTFVWFLGTGNYCPSPAQQLQCPKDHYCPTGSVEPIGCSILSTCPAGSGVPDINFTPVISLFSFFVVVLLLIVASHYLNLWNVKRKLKKWDRNGTSSLGRLLGGGKRNGSSLTLQETSASGLVRVSDQEFVVVETSSPLYTIAIRWLVYSLSFSFSSKSWLYELCM